MKIRSVYLALVLLYSVSLLKIIIQLIDAI